MKAIPIILAVVCLLHAGCTVNGFKSSAARLREAGATIYAPRPYMTEERAKELKNIYSELGDPLTTNGRAFVYSAVFDINADYGRYVDVLTGGKATLNIAYDTTNLALTGAATAISPASTKTVLAGVSTFLQGQKASMDKNLFDDKALFALTSIMEVRRSAALSAIMEKVNSKDYKLGEALVDLESLYRAGSLQTALQASYLNQQEPTTAAKPEKKTPEEAAKDPAKPSTPPLAPADNPAAEAPSATKRSPQRNALPVLVTPAR